MALQMRPFLTVSEMAGLPVAQVANIESETALNYGKQVGKKMDNQMKGMQLQELQTSQAESDAWNKRLAAALTGGQPQQQQDSNIPPVDQAPAAPTQVAAVPQQPAYEPAVASPVRQPGPIETNALPPQIQSTGDFARYDRAQPAPMQPVQAAGNEPAPEVQQVVVQGQRMTPEQKAAYDAQNPPVQEERAPAVQSPAAAQAPSAGQEVQTIAQTVTQAPAGAVKIPPLATYANAMRSTPVGPQGQFNPMSDDYAKTMQQTLMEAVQAGEMRPSTAQAIFMANQSAVNKGLEDRYKMLEAGAKAREAGLKGDELAQKLVKEKRDQQIDNAQIVLNTYKESPAAAQAILTPLGFGGMDLSNPDHLKALAGLASSSKEGVETRKEGRAAKVDTSGLPDTLYRLPGKGAQIFKNVNGVDTPVSPEEAVQIGITQRKASAPSTTVNTGDNPYGGPGDKKFAEGVGEDDSKQLRILRDSSIAVKRNISNYKQIETLVTNPDGSVKADLPLGPGQGLVGLAERLGIKDKNEMGLFVRNMVGQASSALELDAAGMMKGQGAITDAERSILRKAAAGDFANFTAKEWADYSKVMQRASLARIESNNSEIQNIGTRRKLDNMDTWLVPVKDLEPIRSIPANPNTPVAAPQGLPQVGKVVNGYEFKGGDPNNKSNWVKK